MAKDDSDRPRVLVTGASGFLGTPCVELLLRRGFEVHAVSREAGAEGRRLHWIQADLFETEGLGSLMAAVKPSHLLHLAWASGRDGFRDGVENYRWVAISLELLRHFADQGGRRIVAVGTGAEYDWHEGLCSERSTPLAPDSTYGLAKRTFSELFDRYLLQHPGLDGAWARLFFLYGPREDGYRLMASAIAGLLRGEVAECTFDRLRRDYLFVEDAARGIVDLLESSVSGAINIASGEATALGDLVLRAADRLGRRDLVRLGGKPNGGDHPAPVVFADIARARRILGWRPQWRLDDALDRTIEWWRDELAIAG